MPTLTALHLPPPRNWQDFEDLCCDLWRRLWNDPNARKNGRSGQPQAGVDIFGQPDCGKQWAGVQCKAKDSLTGSGLSPEEIEAEAEKARSFEPPLSSFTIATTGLPDTRVLKAARDLTDRWPFRVAVSSWSDIVQDLAGHPDLVAKHFPQFRLALGPSHSRHSLLPPKLPPHYLERSTYLEGLKQALLSPTSDKVGITGQGVHGLQGMSGIGKTVLATAVVWDPRVQAAFPDGVFWLRVGQQPNLLGLLTELAAALGEPEAAYTSILQARGAVSKLLAGRASLLVLDDVWNLDDAQAFDLIVRGARLLLTTRNTEVLVGLGATEHRLDVLSPDQALVLLADWAGETVSELPPVASEVARECGYLPLALAMVGALVRDRPTGWSDALAHLKGADLEKLKRAFPYDHPDLLRALDISVGALEPWQRERYFELAVFTDAEAIPEAALDTLWSIVDLKPADSHDLAALFIARSLAFRDEAKRLRLHDLQADYVRKQTADLPSLHRRLVEAYRARCANGFASGPNDGYFFQRLPFHLAGATMLEELRSLLFDFPWLSSKLQATDVNTLLADFELLQEHPDAALLQSALRLSAHVLVKDKAQLSSQLLGRLERRESSQISILLNGSRVSSPTPRLYPRFPTLIQAGGPLIRTLEGHTQSINAVARIDDKRVVSASYDKTLRVWDLKSGQALLTLEGHTDRVNAVAPLSAQRLASASRDGTLRVWDLESGLVLSTLTGHSRSVNAVACLDERRIVSASEDQTLRVWDVESGRTIRILQGHHGSVNAVAVLRNQRIVSASYDNTLRVWDPESAESVMTLRGHTRPVNAAAEINDQLIVSASYDNTLRVWDLASKETVRILEGHWRLVNDVARIDDRRVVSASDDGTLRVWDLKSGQTIFILYGHSRAVNTVAKIDARRVVSGSLDNTLRVWDVESGQTIRTFQGNTGSVLAIACVDKQRVASASQEKQRLWDVESGTVICTFKGRHYWIYEAARLDEERIASLWGWGARLDDRHVMSGFESPTIKVHETTTGSTLTAFTFDAPTTVGTVMPDGRTIAVGDEMGGVHFLVFED